MTKYLEMLAEIAELKDDYEKFYEQYGKCRNDEDFTVGVKTAELLTFNTSGDEQICLREHVDRMKEGQNDIWHITGESIAVVSSSPFEENLRQKGLEVLYMADPVDEYAVQQLKEFDGKKLKSTTKEGLDIGDEDEKKKLEELKSEFEPLTKLMKEVLGDKVEKVMVSDRIVDSPCVLTTSEYGCSDKIERITESHALRDSSMTSHMVSKKTMENPTRTTRRSLELKSRQDLHGHLQQQHKSNQHQPTKNNQHQFIKQSAHQERGGESKKERDQEEREKEEREVEEGGSELVEKDVTGWTEVTRKKKRKTVQIFVKVDGSKVSPMEVSLTDDRVEDVMRRIQNDEDAYVTMHGRVLKKGERLKSCGVTDGCTIQVTSRLRGGGKHKDKKGQKERKRAAKPQEPEQKAVQECDRDAAIRMIEENEESRKMMVRMLQENEDNRKMIESMSEGSDIDMEQTLQNYQTACRDVLGWDREQVGMMERGLRWAVEARRKERREEQEQRREEEQEKEQRREEQEQRRQEQQEETRADSTHEPEVTSTPVEVRTGRGSAGLVRGGDGRHLADESNRTGKGKGKGNEGKGEHEGKGDKGGKGFQQSTKMMKGGEELKSEENETHKELKREEEQETAEEDEGRVRMAPNMGAGGSHPQATSDPEEESRAQEAREEESRAQEAREEESRAQEAREEESRAQEAREEESRAQEAREEESRAQEAREEESRAQEAREEESRAQEARERRRRERKRAERRRRERKRAERRRRERKRAERRRRERNKEERRRRERSRRERRRRERNKGGRRKRKTKRGLRKSKRDWRERPRLWKSEESKTEKL